MVPWSQLRQPFSGWVMTVRTTEFTNFKLVIHLSKLQQPAILFFQPLRLSRWSCGPRDPSVLHSVKWCHAETARNLRFLQQFHSDIVQHYMRLDQAGTRLSGVVFFLLVFWWGETCCAPNSLELGSCFMPIGAWLDHGPGAGNNRTTF